MLFDHRINWEESTVLKYVNSYRRRLIAESWLINAHTNVINQRWSPRGHIFKSFAFTLASQPQVLENCPVLGSRTALFFEWLKFCRSAEKCYSRPFFFEIDRKKNFKTFFSGIHLHLCPRSLASSIPVLGLGFFLCPWPRALCPRLHLCNQPLGW